MNRKLFIGAVITALICVLIALNGHIIDPADFSGAWYYADDGALYIFDDGIIECADREIIVVDNAVFSGAYTYAKRKAAIFLIDGNGVGEVTELHLVHHRQGDLLCEIKDGEKIVWFYRNKNHSGNG